jgi:hypothetical protein
MNSNAKTGLTIGAVVILLILIGTYFVMSFSVQSKMVDLDEVVNAEKSVVESKLDAMNKTLRDFVGVTSKESETFLEFQKIVASSKEGQSLGGMMTAITEVYPNFDVKGFSKLYPTIEAQRKEFHTQQTIYNERVRAYNAYRRKPIGKFFLDAEEFPKREQFVVSSSASKKAMETGIDDTELEF